jgi:hypothetical protein
MHKNAIKHGTKLVLHRDTLRRLADQELHIVHGGIVTYETVTDEMGVCCLMSRDIPCC